MKTLTKLLCALLCIAMLFSMVACNSTNKETDAPKNSDTEAIKPTEKPTEQATQAPNNEQNDDENKNENNDENKDEPEEEKITRVYEMTLFCGDYGSYAVNNYNSDGVLLSTEIHSEDVYFFSVMIFEHKYDENGIIDKTVVYREIDYCYSNSTDRLDEIATIEWTTDDSGKILSGTTGRDYDIPAFYDFTYHANGKLAKVELRDMGMYKNELAFSVEYDENGTKIRETFDGDVEATFKYTDGLITEMTQTSLHNENDVATSKSTYDELGRITEIKYTASDEEYTFNISFIDNTNIPSGMEYTCRDLEDGDFETQNLTITYTENGFVSKINEVFVEDGESYYSNAEITYDTNNNVVGRIITNIEPGDDFHYVTKDKMEYDDKGQLIKQERENSKIDTANGGASTVTSGRVTTYTYDENGNRTMYYNAQLDQNGDPTYKNINKYEYDSNGFITKNESFYYGDGQTLSSRSLSTMEYNERGQVTKRTSYSFGEDKTSITGYNVRITEYAEDSTATKYTVSDYNKDGALSRTETYVYDENGDVIGGNPDKK